VLAGLGGAGGQLGVQVGRRGDRDEVDVVSITTPPDLHPELTAKAARAGKHVCIEKPVALDWKGCLETQKAVKQAGVKTVVSFCLHWNPSLVNTRNLID